MRGSWIDGRAVPAGVEERDVSMDERALRAFCSRAYMRPIAATEDMMVMIV